MKRNIFYCVGLAMLIAMTACKNGEYSYEYNYDVPTVNIITNLEDGTGVASKVTYSYNAKDENGVTTGVITASGIVLDGQSYNLTTTNSAYQSNMYTVSFGNVSGVMAGNSNIPVSDGKFVFTTVFNTPRLLGLTTNFNLPAQFAICQYHIGENYTVKTYPENAFYTGETVTSYPGSDGMESNTTDGIVYQVSLNLNEGTVTFIMYNAKFSGSDREPLKTQVNLEGLDITYSYGNIIISGENIIPVVVEGTTTTPYEDYVFNTFEFKTTSADLTECEVNYTVAGRFQGSFKGNYLYTGN